MASDTVPMEVDAFLSMYGDVGYSEQSLQAVQSITQGCPERIVEQILNEGLSEHDHIQALYIVDFLDDDGKVDTRQFVARFSKSRFHGKSLEQEIERVLGIFMMSDSVTVDKEHEIVSTPYGSAPYGSELFWSLGFSLGVHGFCYQYAKILKEPLEDQKRDLATNNNILGVMFWSALIAMMRSNLILAQECCLVIMRSSYQHGQTFNTNTVIVPAHAFLMKPLITMN